MANTWKLVTNNSNNNNNNNSGNNPQYVNSMAVMKVQPSYNVTKAVTFSVPTIDPDGAGQDKSYSFSPQYAFVVIKSTSTYQNGIYYMHQLESGNQLIAYSGVQSGKSVTLDCGNFSIYQATCYAENGSVTWRYSKFNQMNLTMKVTNNSNDNIYVWVVKLNSDGYSLTNSNPNNLTSMSTPVYSLYEIYKGAVSSQTQFNFLSQVTCSLTGSLESADNSISPNNVTYTWTNVPGNISVTNQSEYGLFDKIVYIHNSSSDITTAVVGQSSTQKFTINSLTQGEDND